jgi:hypothetical protein
MKLLFIFALIFSASVFSHENTTYPVLSNKTLLTTPPSTLSVVVDADLNKTGFRFIFTAKDGKEFDQGQFFNIVLKDHPNKDEVSKFMSNAILDKNESGKNKLVYTATLPLDEPRVWIVGADIQSNGKPIDHTCLPVEINLPGPSTSDFVLYSLPFVILGGVGLRVFIYKRKKSQLELC